jgi:hypothetical protein
MFLTFGQITLVQDLGKRQADDAIVYVQQKPLLLENQVEDRTLWPDFGNFQAAYFQSKWKEMQRYGTIYLDTREQWCVVPDTWSQTDADLAKQAIPLA